MASSLLRAPRLSTAALALALAAPAAAQVSAAAERASGLPAGIAAPALGVAAVEEPTALSVNPAGIGFVGGPALQYFHEAGPENGAHADGVWLATRLGPLGTGLSLEWMRPDGAPRYRRTRLGLSLGDGRQASVGVAWNWLSSPDHALERVSSWDAGLTLRPARALSLGFAVRDADAHLAGARLPLHYDVGAATRFWKDRVTLSADLLADDTGSRFRGTHAQGALAVESTWGFAFGVQVQAPIRDEPGRKDALATMFTVAWNDANAGWIGGVTTAAGETGWLAGARFSQERYLSPPGGSGLPSVDLDRALRPRRFLVFELGERDPYGALLQRLAAAQDDPEVAGLVLKIDGLDLGGGRIEELRAAVAALRQKKPVFAWLEGGGGTREYWLATAATAIATPPGAALMVNGISTSQLFLKEGLARLGVTFEVVKAGAYKSATEPLVRTESSPEAREAVNALLDDVYARMVSDIAEGRKLTGDQVRQLLDRGLFSAEEARAAGLVDATAWPDELEAWARRTAGRRFRDGGEYRPDPPRSAQRWGRPPVIEIVRLEGVIARDRVSDPTGGGAVAGAERAARAIAAAARDPDVKAIVLRIESPGGDGLASDLVWREVVRARRRKPVVASLGDVAASGGYLVAVGADVIVAEPSTITGSIGVFAAKPDLGGLLEKLSVKREAYPRGENAQLLSLWKPWTPSERKVLEKQIAAFYALFLDRVAEGRKLPRAEVEAVAGGRVWTGRQAMDRRLVDRLGSLADAVALARERARLPADDEIEIRRAGTGRGLVARALEGPAGDALAGVLEAGEPAAARALRAVPGLAELWLVSELGPVLALPYAWFPAVVEAR